MEAKIPYAQALKLGDLFSRASALQEAIGALQGQLAQRQALLQTLIGALELPLDKGFQMKIEDGADDDGMVAVTWKDPPPKPEKPKKPAKPPKDK
ncbi:unnamed protein product [marine sediment metagenome]|uniref:Uncharacterized protein n=1 Tax=marine sediment metagenome TaxID=412755 RepID=X1ER33_9ZZZZ